MRRTQRYIVKQDNTGEIKETKEFLRALSAISDIQQVQRTGTLIQVKVKVPLEEVNSEYCEKIGRIGGTVRQTPPDVWIERERPQTFALGLTGVVYIAIGILGLVWCSYQLTVVEFVKERLF